MQRFEDLLRDASQTRFCATFINNRSKKPIIGMPVYAEARATPSAQRSFGLEERERQYVEKVLQRRKRPNASHLIDLFESSIAHRDEAYDYQDIQTILDAFLQNLGEMLKAGEDGIDDDTLRKMINEAIEGLKSDGRITPIEPAAEEGFLRRPFGFLSTDQVGFVSFDIADYLSTLPAAAAHDPVAIDLTFWMFPYGADARGIEVSALGKITSDYIYGNLEIDELPVEQAVSYHSMHNPGLIEWYLSPSSFSINPRYMIGADGCEQFYPANFATSEFRFHQIVRGAELEATIQVRQAILCEYQTMWRPLGHTLGEVIYSLPLAPGEVVKIAIINWTRSSTDGRQEDTGVTETLDHATLRDRAITETVEGALSEWQRGGTITGGNSGGAGISFGMQNLGVSGGNAHSFGGGYSTSSGNRDFTASTVQHVNDAFSQHSASRRELQSTVVVTSDQKEYAKAETRVVANYNHSHALTMLYYAVQRHFKVTTRFVRTSSAMMVNYRALWIAFDEYVDVQKNRLALQNALLDERFRPGFDIVDKYFAAEGESVFQNSLLPAAEAATIFESYNIVIETGDNGFDGDVVGKFTTFGKGTFDIQASVNGGSARPRFEASFEQGDTNSFSGCFVQDGPLSWGDLDRIEIAVDGGQAWRFRKLSVDGVLPDKSKRSIFNDLVNVTLEDDGLKSVSLSLKRPLPQVQIPPAMNTLAVEERAILYGLMEHIRRYAGHYNRAIWMQEDADDRATRFGEITVGGVPLIDLVENRPVDVLGDFVVFPAGLDYDEDAFGVNPEAKDEKLITLPSRGVFGEAKLGHCNASEMIDNTRFWDWQQSPIPQTAPEIAAVDTGSRNVTPDLTPTALPSAIVNIVNPVPAPDPSAMAGALTLLGKSDIFRDMSMSGEVTDLLKQLSQDATKYGEMANKARGILDKSGAGTGSDAASPLSATTPQAPSASPPQSTPPATPSTPAQAESASIDNTAKKLKIAKEQLPPAQQEQVRSQAVAELTAVERNIWIDLHSADEGTILQVVEDADYDIGNMYQGKLHFVDGKALVKTKETAGPLHIKFLAMLGNIPGRDYVDRIPGIKAQTGAYYYDTTGYFDFSDKTTISMKGVLTLGSPVKIIVHTDVSGNVTVTGGVEAELAVAKISGGLELSAGVEAGTQVEYEVTRISGVKLSQFPPIGGS